MSSTLRKSQRPAFYVGCLAASIALGLAAGADDTHWSFKKPVRQPAPPTRLKGWVRNPIDSFIVAAFEKKGLTPSPAADRRTLLRRVTFDLTGLPPTAEEIAEFVNDKSADGYEKVVKRLLASPRYGERWAQHWLDVARFGETNGYELDADRPQAWRYRDWVVRALNEDKSYDQFICEQIAGDEIDPSNFDLRVATHFLRGGPRHVVSGNVDPREVRQEWLTEAVQGIGSAILGLTVQCARCHDHKFDPIPQKDYYQLQAFFAATNDSDLKRSAPDEQEAYDAAVKAIHDRQKPVNEQIAAIEKPYREKLREMKRAKLDADYRQALDTEPSKRTPQQQKLATEAQKQLNVSWDEVVNALLPPNREQRAALRKQLHVLEAQMPPPPSAALGVGEVITPTPASHVLVRGEYTKLGEKVEPQFITVLNAGRSLPAAAGTQTDTTIGSDQNTATRTSVRPATSSRGRRTALAQWLTQPDHPLTARVIVNRLWQHHFGRGLVATTNDFGRNGQPPTHPELLDWLATTFVRQRGNEYGCGWSLKAMHYLMVTSATYRQGSIADSGMRNAESRSKPSNPQFAIRNPQSIDPGNRLLWRQNRQRLDAEALRDATLDVAGTLTSEMSGPSVRVPLEPEVYDRIFTEGEPDNLWPLSDAKQHTRRSLYLLRKRNVRLPMMVAFDAPDMMTSCAARQQSVHALQALTLINSDFMQQQSQSLAKRLLNEFPGDEQKRIERLYTLALGRLPQPPELRAIQKFLSEQTAIIRARLSRGETITRLSGIPSKIDPATAAAWADLCLATLNLNEFVYVK